MPVEPTNLALKDPKANQWQIMVSTLKSGRSNRTVAGSAWSIRGTRIGPPCPHLRSEARLGCDTSDRRHQCRADAECFGSTGAGPYWWNFGDFFSLSLPLKSR